MERPLTESEVSILVATFPELSWMKPEDWQSVAAFSDWRTWIDEKWATTSYNVNETHLALRGMLAVRKGRRDVRSDCRSYFGSENVPNINDPSDPTWA